MRNVKFCNRYSCEFVIKSTKLLNVKYWIFIIPVNFMVVGLPTKIRRFTILRSPLGNKKSKDQFELREYGVFVSVVTNNVSFLLYLLDVIRNPVGVKIKVKVSRV